VNEQAHRPRRVAATCCGHVLRVLGRCPHAAFGAALSEGKARDEELYVRHPSGPNPRGEPEPPRSSGVQNINCFFLDFFPKKKQLDVRV
jgi:hypothetical protein